jgi:tetratricopeptide (TPR) repeat protein
MEDFAKEAEKYSTINPKLSTLYGFIYFDQADMFINREGKYEEAIDLLTRALAFGDFWGFYNKRAKIYHFDLMEQDKALEDINRSIVLRPTRESNYRLRSRIILQRKIWINLLKTCVWQYSLHPIVRLHWDGK